MFDEYNQMYILHVQRSFFLKSINNKLFYMTIFIDTFYVFIYVINFFIGARVILACRNIQKANDAVEDIKKNPPSKYE